MEELPEDDKLEEPRMFGGDEDHGEGGKSKRPKLVSATEDSVEDEQTCTKAEMKEDNLDSGICVDKTEADVKDSVSPECNGNAVKTQGDNQEEPTVLPGNSVVNAAASTSNIACALGTDRPGNSLVNHPCSGNIAWVLGIKKPIKSRNYRKHRNTLDRSTDSDDSMSEVDSDDISLDGMVVGGGEREAGPAADSEEESRQIVDEGSHATTPRSDPEHSDNSDRPPSESESSDSLVDTSEFSAHSTDTEEVDHWTDPETGPNEDNQEYQTPSALLKPKPKHNWFLMKELRNREMGLSVRPGLAAKTDALFEQRYYGSLHSVYRLELMYKLDRHRGCVNSINFHPEGHLLASGSDDLNVIVWDWTTNTVRQVLRTGHKSNVFQSRFLHLNSSSQLNIVTCARDGQVRLIQCPASGGSVTGAGVVRRRLAAHTRSAHKLHVSAAEPHVVISCGEDGQLLASDVRTDRPTKVVTVRDKGSPVALYSIHGHPLEPRELLVAGRNSYVRVYDRRKPNKPVSMYCPSFFSDNMENASKKKHIRFMSLYVTCAVYNHDGSEILASYNDDDIYLFDALADRYEKDVTKEGYTHRYAGHRNSATFKGVAFFGPRSEFVVSGSDCSHIYVWDRNTEAIVQWMHGDEGGVVNCIESHPRFPVLASSGLDKDVKIWVPSNEEDPRFSGLKEVVNENNKAQLRSPLFNDFLPTLYSAWNRNSREFSEEDPNPRSIFGGNIDFDGQVCTTF